MHRKTTKKSAILLKIGGYDVGNSNKTLSAASKAKQDEFYTQLSDIENELKHYKDEKANLYLLRNFSHYVQTTDFIR